MVRTTVALRWRDIDLLGHMYQGRYHELLDEARADVFAPFAGRLGYPFVLVNVNLDYRHEVVRADQALEIITTVERIGDTSVVLTHAFHRADETLVADGTSTLVAWDRDARCARPVSADERAVLASLAVAA